MSGPEQTQVYRDAKALVESIKKLSTGDSNFHNQLLQWKSSIHWDDIINGPVLEISEPFGFLTALAGRIHDDCAVTASGGHIDDYQARLQDLRSKAQSLHKAFTDKGTTIETTASAMKKNKDLAFEEEANINKKLSSVNEAKEAIVKEAEDRSVSIAKLDKELTQISTNLQNDLQKINALPVVPVKSVGLVRFEVFPWFSKLFDVSDAHQKSIEDKKSSLEQQRAADEKREAEKRTERSNYEAILLDLTTVKNNLIVQKDLLETARRVIHDDVVKLTDVSDKWYKIVGNVGILNNRLSDIDKTVLADFIPTIVDISDAVVRAANEGCRFLQYAGVEAELKATLEKIEKANDRKDEHDRVVTLKKNLWSVRGLIDATVQELPRHATDASWFPQPLPLPHGTEEM